MDNEKGDDMSQQQVANVPVNMTNKTDSAPVSFWREHEIFTVILLTILLLALPVIAVLIGSIINQDGMLSYDFSSNVSGLFHFGLLDFILNAIASNALSLMIMPYAIAGIFIDHIFGVFSVIQLLTFVLMIVAFVGIMVYFVRHKSEITKRTFFYSILILDIIWSVFHLLLTATAPQGGEGGG